MQQPHLKPEPHAQHPTGTPGAAVRPRNLLLRGGACLGAALLLASCAVEVQNRQAAQELAKETRPPGSVYKGWRVYQEKCASCHGPSANGTASAPDLMPRVRYMGARQFVSLVLKRYDWGLPPTDTNSQGSAREALIDKIEQRKDYPLTMPAWQGEPTVTVHIADLYAYLTARAEGSQGSGRPVF